MCRPASTALADMSISSERIPDAFPLPFSLAARKTPRINEGLRSTHDPKGRICH